ncbi:hypothetical protein WG947_15905 [Pontibacter sp. H259]|uniref:hypothetical protein n=1 Tax=Pontibacter sp. H259 TaxID=3133421 RepID=UPI0030BB0186
MTGNLKEKVLPHFHLLLPVGFQLLFFLAYSYFSSVFPSTGCPGREVVTVYAAAEVPVKGKFFMVSLAAK